MDDLPEPATDPEAIPPLLTVEGVDVILSAVAAERARWIERQPARNVVHLATDSRHGLQDEARAELRRRRERP